MSETRKISLQFPSLRSFLDEYGSRISPEGILLESGDAPAAGERVRFEVVLADGMKLLQAAGQTVWRGRPAGGSGPERAAVRFGELDQASRKLIEKIVDQNRRRGSEPFRLDRLAPAAAGPSDPEQAAAAATPAARAPGGPVFDLPPVGRAADRAAAAGTAAGAATAASMRPPAEPVSVPPVVATPSEDRPAAGEGATAADEAVLEEAFPASFVDEVEAELAVPEAEISFGDLDTSRTEVSPASGAEPSSAAPGGDAGASVPKPPTADAASAPAAGAPAVEPPQMILEPGPPPSIEESEADIGEAAPVVTMPVKPAPAATAASSVPVRGPAEGRVEPSPPEPTSREPLPTPEALPPVSAAESDLLSVPELTAAPAAAGIDEAVAGPEAEAIPGAELRGAARRSHRFGTILLIVLLAAALLAAGYIFFTYLRQDRIQPAEEPPPEALMPPATAPSSPPPIELVEPEAPAESEATPPAEPEESPLPAAPAAGAVMPGGPRAEEAAPLPEVDSPAPAAAAPLRIVERISWEDRGSETVLTLVGDGRIGRGRLELARIGGTSPRAVLKISGVQRPFQPAALDVGTAQLVRVRTGLHAVAAGRELHVVLDLADPSVAVSDPVPSGRQIELRLESTGG